MCKLFAILSVLLTSCSVHQDNYKIFKKNYIYENITPLRIEKNVNESYGVLFTLLRGDEKYPDKIFPKGEKVLIEEIYCVYPDTSGITIVKGKIITGKFKGIKIRIGTSHILHSNFIEVGKNSLDSHNN